MEEKTREVISNYSRREARVLVLTHLTGVVFILLFGNIILQQAQGLIQFTGVGVYILTFFGVFLASSTYHGVGSKKWKGRLKKLDHIAIYFFIAGSNTPYLLAVSDGTVGRIFLAVMWLLVLLGSLYKIKGWDMNPWISLLFYLFMGWLGVVTVYLLYPNITNLTFYLVLIGGLFYTIGTYFFHHDHREWYHSVWHVFVLLGACTHFAALYYQL